MDAGIIVVLCTKYGNHSKEEKYICTVGTLAQTAKEHNITKTALMIIGEAVTHSNYARSELYNPNFSTEYRKAKGEDKA